MKRSSYYYFAIIGIFLAVASSCSKENVYVDSPNLDRQGMARSAYSKEELNRMRKEFGTALAKALKESSLLRALIKAKALEMIDKDYDVLYHLIKNEKLENNISVRELIGKYYSDKNGLKRTEKLLPTLTIMVPTLPMNSFSAQIWDANSQIPMVGVTSTQTNDVTMIDASGKEFALEAKYFPSFPILVIKECERILDNSNPEYNKVNSASKFVSQDGDFSYRFIDDAFDGKLDKQKKKKDGGRLAYDFNTDQKVKSAAILFAGTDNWHRDHIYYNMTPTVDKGPFTYDFTETLTTFRIADTDARGTLSKIADQSGDPRLNSGSWNTSQNSFWTSGSFSFKARLLLNSTNGTGAETNVYFDCRPDQLFYLTYDQVIFPNMGRYYVVRDVIPIPLALYIPVFKWDLQQYSFGIKVTVEEIDEPTTTTISEQQVSKFAVNFGIDSGIIKKLGLKFGASFAQDRTQTIQKVITQGNDELGDATVTFADKVITDHNPSAGTYVIQEFSGGRFWITLEPKKTQ